MGICLSLGHSQPKDSLQSRYTWRVHCNLYIISQHNCIAVLQINFPLRFHLAYTGLFLNKMCSFCVKYKLSNKSFMTSYGCIIVPSSVWNIHLLILYSRERGRWRFVQKPAIVIWFARLHCVLLACQPCGSTFPSSCQKNVILSQSFCHRLSSCHAMSSCPSHSVTQSYFVIL